ncbi:MAG: hypothetical protein PHN89_00595, partial [Candidatus Pacebacteria bacterium]|nr:hypothetical protein [Candidatus Paceibacterota bacterium]
KADVVQNDAKYQKSHDWHKCSENRVGCDAGRNVVYDFLVEVGFYDAVENNSECVAEKNQKERDLIFFDMRLEIEENS